MRFKTWAVVALLSSSMWAADLVFVVGEWPPFVGETEVDYGSSAKQVTDTCEKAGLECQIEFMPWKRAITLTKKGVADGTFPWVGDAEGRAEAFIVSPKLFDSKTVIFYTGELPEGAEKDYSKLSAKKPVGINSYTDAEKVKSMGVKIHMVNSGDLAWKMIEKGRADAFIDDADVGMAECKKHAPSVCDQIKMSPPVRSAPMNVLFSRVGDDAKNANIKKFIEAMQ